MSGIFGSVLAIFNFIGGIILGILIGSRAWTSNRPARNFRLVFAGYCIGAAIGGVLLMNKHIDSYDWEAKVFVLMPLLTIVIVFALELIKWLLDQE